MIFSNRRQAPCKNNTPSTDTCVIASKRLGATTRDTIATDQENYGPSVAQAETPNGHGGALQRGPARVTRIELARAKFRHLRRSVVKWGMCSRHFTFEINSIKGSHDVFQHMEV